MAENVTKPTDADPSEFIAAVEHPTRRADAETLLQMMERLSGCHPKMWGPSIIGFGRYTYRYDSGGEGESMLCGFSPRKSNQVVYTMPGYSAFADQLSRLGKHQLGNSCLYINKLADVDLDVLEEIVSGGIAHMRATHDTFDD